MTKYCPYCGEEIMATAKKCKHCNEFLDPELRSISQQQMSNIVNNVSVSSREHQRWNPAFAMILSLLIPGLGQMYKGQLLNGIAWLIITVIGYTSFVIPGLVIHLFCILGAGMGNPNR